MTSETLEQIQALSRFSLTKTRKFNFYETSCQSCKMSSAINEKTINVQ